jgi:hypothetical protein
MPFREHISALQNIEANYDSIIMDIIAVLENAILDMQRDQLAAGELETGNPIMPNYHPMTVELRSAVGLQVDYPDLNFTGAHYSNFWIDFGADYFEITNDDKKAKALQVKYNALTGNIYGLTDANVQKVIDDVKPQLIQKIRERWLTP